MGKPLSTDLGARALAAVDGGMSRLAAAKRFEVGASSVIRWDAARRATGASASKAQGGEMRSRRLEARGADAMAAFQEARDQTLVEVRGRLAARGTATSKSALSRFFPRRRITRKRMIRPVGQWAVSGSVRSCANVSGVAALRPSP